MIVNYYAEVIELCSKEQDWKDIVIKIAKHHPGVVFKAITGVNDDWKKKARTLYLTEGKKVEAIKYCRNETGMGLKEAKEAVEALK
jgi:ribosomal protein L7/L12